MSKNTKEEVSHEEGETTSVWLDRFLDTGVVDQPEAVAMEMRSQNLLRGIQIQTHKENWTVMAILIVLFESIIYELRSHSSWSSSMLEGPGIRDL